MQTRPDTTAERYFRSIKTKGQAALKKNTNADHSHGLITRGKRGTKERDRLWYFFQTYRELRDRG